MMDGNDIYLIAIFLGDEARPGLYFYTRYLAFLSRCVFSSLLRAPHI